MVRPVNRCPSCAEAVRPFPENAVFPFCSPRCKMVDLGNWLNENYRVPAETVSIDDERPPTDQGED